MKLVSHLKKLFHSPFDHDTARSLYLGIVARARDVRFYDVYGVPDTPEGRFDMVALHTCLVIRQLQRDSAANRELSQALFDIMFADMDQNMREMSIGDTGVARRIKKMAEGFYGRAKAYDGALDSDDNRLLTEAIDRNVFRNALAAPENLNGLARYVRRCADHLNGDGGEALGRGTLDFPDVDGPRSP